MGSPSTEATAAWPANATVSPTPAIKPPECATLVVGVVGVVGGVVGWVWCGRDWVGVGVVVGWVRWDVVGWVRWGRDWVYVVGEWSAGCGVSVVGCM